MDDEELMEALESMANYGWVEVACTQCDEVCRIEPDADYPCPEEGCGGRVTSPLMREGLI